jgi:hypothetical protein
LKGLNPNPLLNLVRKGGVIMRVAYLGNFTQTHCTEVHLAATLEDLGHSVMRLQENGYSPEELGNILDQADIDLFLFTRTWGETLTLEHLAHLRERKIPSASYHLDLYVGLARKYLHLDKTLEEVLQKDPFWRTDFVFTPDGDPSSQAVFEANGVNHIYMKPGVYQGECYLSASEGKKHDVLFVGGGDRPGSPHGYGHPEWPYRDKLIGWLYDTYKERFTKFGHPQQTIRNDELNQLYADSKVVVGDSVCLQDFTHSYYWSDRVYETIGRGGFLIHPYIKGLEEEFANGENIVFYDYGNFTQLQGLIDYYLEHDDEREKIRAAGQELVRTKCTYNQRLSRMIDIIGSSVAVPTPSTEVPSIPSQSFIPEEDSYKITKIEGLKLHYDEPIKINLGSGNDPLPEHVNVDMLDREDVDVIHNLMDFPYPFEDGSATHIEAIDLIEHLDHYTDDKQPTIMAFIKECHRILQPGGELYIQTPSWDSELFKIDPTHVRGFHRNSFDFFDPDTYYGKIRDFYDAPKFQVRSEELENKNLRFWLVKR